MRSTSPAVITLLDSRDPFVFADCFTFTLTSGLKLRYTNAQQPITIIPSGEINPVIFYSNEVLVEGMVLKSSIGIDVDEQDLMVYAYPTAAIAGLPFMISVRQGVLDGGFITRERVYMYDWGQPIVGSMLLFTGRVAAIDPAGDTKISMKVKSETIVLDEDMPRNYFQMECKNTLFDQGCSLIKSSFAVSGSVGAGSTTISINWAGATLGTFDLGTITLEDGPNVGQSRTIRASTGSQIILVTPFEYTPLTGNIFKAFPGCNLSRTTCLNKFNNEVNFRGFPFVPPPETAV